MLNHLGKLQVLTKGIQPLHARVLILGLTFKENCPDVRNTKVVDIVSEMQEYGANVDVWDPWVNAAQAKAEHGIDLVSEPEDEAYDVVLIAVAHDQFKELGQFGIREFCKKNAVIYDIKYILPADAVDGRL